jgi:hypothetical protein
MKSIAHMPKSIYVFILTFLIYAIMAGGMFTEQSLAPHYVLLADSLSKGRLDIDARGNYFDLIGYEGKSYVSSPPMPAFLLTPIVYLTNTDFSDVLFSVFIGAVILALVQKTFQNGWLTLFFGFGTANIYFAPLGSMWFLAQQTAILFSILALGAAIKQKWGWVGIWWGMAILSRPPLAFGTLFFLVWIWWQSKSQSFPPNLSPRKLFTHYASRIVPHVLRLALPLLIAIIIYGAYNYARFGNPTDFGYANLDPSPNIRAVLNEYGTFHPRFASCNAFVGLLMPFQVSGYVPTPTYQLCDYLLQGANLSDTSATIVPNGIGMSIFLVSPAFFLLFWAKSKHPLIIGAWLGLIGTMLPTLFLHNTGSLQFGYRYWLDAAPMWLFLLAWVLDDKITHTIHSDNQGNRSIILPPPSKQFVHTLILASIAIHIWGFFWIYEKFVGMPWLIALTER